MAKVRSSRRPAAPSLFDGGDANSATRVAEVFDGARLTQVRQLRALTKKALSDLIGVSPAAIGQYEAGTISPRPEHVAGLAHYLAVPVKFFAFKAGRPRILLDVSLAHFASLRSMRAGERERAVRFVEKVGEVTAVLERYVRLPTVDLPGWSGDGEDRESYSAPAAAARMIRQHWRLGSQPIPHVVRLLESKGIVVTMLPFSESGRVNAFSCAKQLPKPVVILTSDKDDVYRHRFKAAHELGHLLMHGDAQPGDIEHERAANAFAAEFLMPSASITAQLPSRPNFAAYSKIQSVWGVSINSVIYRSRELGLLGDVSYRRAWQKLKELEADSIVSPEPVALHQGEVPVLLKKALHLSADRGLSLQSLADDLALYPEEVAKYYIGEDVPALPEVNVVDMAEWQEQRRNAAVGAS